MPFIRQGAWCSKCERSWNAAGTGHLESGLSVYECQGLGSRRWRAVGNAWKKNVKNLTNRPWFLLDGARTGATGGDGEPLISGITFKATLRRIGTSDEYEEMMGKAPVAIDHPKVDQNGTCRDWNGEEIANGDHEDDDEHDDSEPTDSGP